MTALSVKGLRDALKFPETRIRFASDLPTPPSPRLLGLEIVGDKATIIANADGKVSLLENDPPLSYYTPNTSERFRGPEVNTHTIECGGGNPGHKAITANFINAILHGETLIAEATEGTNGLELGNAMLMAGLTGKRVDVPTDRDAFHNFGGTVETAVRGAFTGSCDLESTTFPGSTAEAPAICTPLCANSGGWVGSWTNEAPPAWPGYSACGCAQCTAESPLPTTVQEPSAMIMSGPALRRYNRN